MVTDPSLAERLGYAAGARVLIVNCDDLGSSHSANVAILRAMDAGIATSATLMVPCSWAREAAAMFRGRDVGIHLTLTCEYPLYRWRSLTGATTLHDDDGFLPATIAEVFAKADVHEARAECRAQIEQALAWGVDVTHLDSHMGSVQIDPRFYAIYVDLAAEFDVPLRMVSHRGEDFLGFPSRAPAAARGLLFTDHFIDPWGRDTAEVFRGTLAALAPGVTEMFAHPVEDGPELRAYDPDNPDVRAGDAAWFTSRELKDLIAASGAATISYRPIREAQRARQGGRAARGLSGSRTTTSSATALTASTRSPRA
ncbi:MAG TPA: polysaccharide deacetylase family protein [Caulobacteraceae bacterium]|nr:polysaccharide deacetylase family protein [Caulobacteraceae bacterium]